MKRACAIILLMVTAAAAGPVGRYLGYEVGRTEVTSRHGRDSIHFFLPAPGDSIFTTSLVDTNTVLAETLLSEPAWILRRSVYGDTVFTAIDTMYEAEDTMLHQPWHLGDSTRWYNHYIVPFNIGSSWRTGIAGIYHTDLDGDGTIDTMTISHDTVSIIGIEDVTVPYGLVEDCWMIRTKMRQSLGLVFQGVPVRETADVYQVQWYKDSLWSVKDSIYIFGRGFVQIIIWLPAANIVSTSVGELTSLYTPVQEPAPGIELRRIIAGPNPFRSSITLSLCSSVPLSLSIFDPSGRLIRTLPAVGRQPSAVSSFSWDGRDELGRIQPAGIYIVRSSNGGAALPALVVKTE